MNAKIRLTLPAERGLGSLHEPALTSWRAGDAAALRALCDAAGKVRPGAGGIDHQPELAWWSGLASLMAGEADALEHMESAYSGLLAAGHPHRATVVACAALVVCLLDNGAMEHVKDWQARSTATGAPEHEPADDFSRFWLNTGRLALVALGGTEGDPDVSETAQWLELQLRPLRSVLSPDERLVAALVLANYYFTVQQFERFELLSSLVEAPAYFSAALPLMRTRWLYTAGFAHYQIGGHEKAQDAWNRALAMAAEDASCCHLQLLVSLALVRLQIDRGEVLEAARLLNVIRPEWGAGRTAQLMSLQQLRARVQLLQDQPNAAFDTLQDALRLADAAKLSAAEYASCDTDMVQIRIALGQEDVALESIEELTKRHTGRDRQVYECLHLLLQAFLKRFDRTMATDCLREGLRLAKDARYTMFFRLLPGLAAKISALALRNEVEVAFVTQVITARKLRAPADADEQWPWVLWVRMLGGVELREEGKAKPRPPGKAQHKPLELLHLLACQTEMALDLVTVEEALWPDSDGDAAVRKNAEMAVLRLRRLLGDDTLLWVSGGRVGLDLGRVGSDVVNRRQLIQRLHSLALQGDRRESAAVTETVAIIERILTLTQGELIPGKATEAPWLSHERERCRLETVRAVLAASSLLAQHGSSKAEVELLQTALRLEPLAELIVCRLMDVLSLEGRRGDALRVFEDLRRTLAVYGTAPGTAALTAWRKVLQPANDGPVRLSVP